MSIWDKIGSAAVAVGLAEATEPEQAAAKNPGQAVAVVPPGTTLTGPAPVKLSTYTPSMDATRQRELDEKARAIIVDALKNDGAPLVEEISDSLETLAEGVPDESACYKMALKMATKRGHSPSAIVNDFDKCLGVLDESRRTFEANMKQAMDSQVGAKVRSVASLDSEIETLQRSLAEKVRQRSEEQAAISVEQTKINQAQERFTVVYGAIRNDIENKRAKIAQHGGL